MLAKLGYDVKSAAGPDEALALVEKRSFHIVFVDNILGTAKGIDLIERLGKLDPGLFFVIMTAYPNVETAIHAMKKGVSDFLQKPFLLEDVLVSIDHVNRKRELEAHRTAILSELKSKVREKTAELEHTYLSVMTALSRAVEKKDLGTYGHSMRVASISVRIADRLGLTGEMIEDVHTTALLHDIGKIGISDLILGKKGPLNGEEMDAIKSHPDKGVEILRPLDRFSSILPAILHHHERYDGTGYPAGLAGDDIPDSARIIAVADTYDAIVSARPYRDAGTRAKAITELEGCAGAQFDSAVVDAFLSLPHEEWYSAWRPGDTSEC